MRRIITAVCCTIVTLLWYMPLLGAETTQCHLHPPASDNQENPQLWSMYPSLDACDLDNHQRYSGLGRCHCAFGDAPWTKEKFRSGNSPPAGTISNPESEIR